MYQHSYAEALEDDQTEARRIEYQALDHAATLLMGAATLAHPSREGVDALHFTCSLWMAFVSEVAAPSNALPAILRANLISIGFWIVKEVEAIRQGRSTNYAGIADICMIVRDGLN